MEYVSSEKGKRKLVLEGFLFVKDKQADNKIYWYVTMFYIINKSILYLLFLLGNASIL